MNSNERLMRIFQGREVDRPALKLWGLEPGQSMIHPAYQPVYDLAMEISDVMFTSAIHPNIILGAEYENSIEVQTIPVSGEPWKDRITHLYLPGRTLRQVMRLSTVGEPGYCTEHFVKDPEDLSALLAAPYRPSPVDITAYREAAGRIGDRGLAVLNLRHAAYEINKLTGSELFAFLCIDERELLREAVERYAASIREYVKGVLEQGIKPVFGWVGPELCIPPLVRMIDFEEFVYDADRQVCDIIHNGGGYVWVHCHGSVGKLITHFEKMGVDVLNPIEPPPQGDITLTQAFEKVGNRMGLEGNIEISDLLMKDGDEVRQIIRKSTVEGRASSRFILCPSAGYMEYIHPSRRYIENLVTYLQYGLECLQE